LVLLNEQGRAGGESVSEAPRASDAESMIQSLGGKFVKIGEGDATMYSVKYGRESLVLNTIELSSFALKIHATAEREKAAAQALVPAKECLKHHEPKDAVAKIRSSGGEVIKEQGMGGKLYPFFSALSSIPISALRCVAGLLWVRKW